MPEVNEAVKVLLVSPLPPPAGGISTWTAALLKAVGDLREVEVVHLDTAVRWRSTNDLALYKRIIGGSLQALRDTGRVWRALRQHRPQVLNLCTSASLSAPKDILIVALARLHGTRSILHYHMGRLPRMIAGKTVEWRLLQLAMKISDVVLLLDRYSEIALARALPALAVKVIPNPICIKLVQEIIESRSAESRGSAKPTIAFAGHVIPTKGVVELVEACLEIESDFHLEIIGQVEDSFRDALQAIAAQRDEGRWVTFHGMLERRAALELMRRCDVFALPSYTEGFPNVVLEAMALGRPVVATPVGAIPEMAGDAGSGHCGILVQPRNVEELREALSFLLSHPEEARLLGARGRARVAERYAMEKVLQQYGELWRSLSPHRAEQGASAPAALQVERIQEK